MDSDSVILQYFEWNVPPGILWRRLLEEAPRLADIGAVWIPPAYKGRGGVDDRGYGVYDLYDLGEFEQKGAAATRYGTREELLAAIRAARACGLEVYADIVLDHRMGADAAEEVRARPYDPKNRLRSVGPMRGISAWTRFTFPGRGGEYSDFTWNWRHFTAIDYDALRGEKGIFKFFGKRWARQVDQENGNFDYLMGASLDLGCEEVKNELIRWGKWFVGATNVDGFRLDAVKHMRFGFYREWLAAMRRAFGRKFFAVGEYWSRFLAPLQRYIRATGGGICLFDVPLHYNFFEASRGKCDLRQIFKNTLAASDPARAVTFVDCHDTQPGQALESWVADWFRPLAHALILLRQEGRPCVFYGDYYGMAESRAMRGKLPALLRARRLYARGRQRDYFDRPALIGWTREGGLAVLCSAGGGGKKRMHVGREHAGAEFYDLMDREKGAVKIGEDGTGLFGCGPKSVAVWVNARGAK